MSNENICDLYRRTGRVELELLATADEATLAEFKGLVDMALVRIKNQLSDAQAEHWNSGTFRDATWYAQANKAARFHGFASQQIQTELGKRRAARRAVARTVHEEKDLLKKALGVLPESQQRLVLVEFARLRDLSSSEAEENFNR